MKSTLLRVDDSIIRVSRYANHLILSLDEGQLDLTHFASHIHKRNYPWCTEVIASEKEICLVTNSQFSHRNLGQLSQEYNSFDNHRHKKINIPFVISESDDIKKVLAHYSASNSSNQIKSEAQLSSLIEQTSFTISMFGFMPGFFYLKGIPKTYFMPRKSIPAKRVASGSIAIGGPYLGIYNTTSPGGWHVLAKTPININIDDIVGKLPIGTLINFFSVSQEAYNNLKDNNLSLTQYNKSNA